MAKILMRDLPFMTQRIAELHEYARVDEDDNMQNDCLTVLFLLREQKLYKGVKAARRVLRALNIRANRIEKIEATE